MAERNVRVPLVRLIALVVCATPAAGWEFSPRPVCTLTHSSDSGVITVTYDAALPEYTLTITKIGGDWPADTTFGMRFDGTNPIAIGTDRHVMNGTTLTVADTGFGNVLNGLQFNDTVTATAGGATVAFDLADAADPVAAFRLCPAPATS